mmetsp:Transcript_8936/g.26838  ORF Transcript_8936/g.26838 Transcript_8936/m.26838 type:complete len:303 (+) Transcript_8936:92-1000(+)|eukprot:CAMPEP_0198728146 /NCGR_PEP_ID=MMETSP1475-20131203/7318_1 /TAXON_ID= ORGANISM="Unidentified sp., Strain CCMP1999" /NCGR_SAMPLE_ID=MMETSP1475 /ASSEMBLY_ACC=CAM_ASM_001111 /LENGTH=302 /DNA_ID=CAMNT_0044490427 /DNA_START=46 /DNA_END=954 /DNA_ORIENTATION=+
MGERKVLIKYYPPDFDPSKLPRNKRPRDQLELIRFMLPVTVRCNTCGEYMYAGKKFNVKKETVQDEDYLGIKIFRFYVKCVSCSAAFTIKTDPKNADYVCETGASRNFEPWRQQEMAEEEVKAALDEETMDAMNALESRTLDAKEEMDILDALDEMKSLRARQGKIGFDKLLAIQHRRYMNIDKALSGEEAAEAAEAEEEKLAKEKFAKKRMTVKRLEDDEEGDTLENDVPSDVTSSAVKDTTKITAAEPPPKKPFGALNGLTIRVKPTQQKKEPPASTKPVSALTSLAAYSDSEGDSDEGD